MADKLNEKLTKHFSATATIGKNFTRDINYALETAEANVARLKELKEAVNHGCTVTIVEIINDIQDGDYLLDDAMSRIGVDMVSVEGLAGEYELLPQLQELARQAETAG